MLKNLSKNQKNGTYFLGTVCQSVPFFRKNAKKFIKTIEKMHTFSGNRVHKCAFFLLKLSWAGLLYYLGE